MAQRKLKIKCSRCGAKCTTGKTAAGNLRPPPGWKTIDDKPWCKACVKAEYRLGAVAFPIVGPVDCDWAVLRELLAKSWAQSTALANWTVRELAKMDVVRLAGDGPKIPRLPRVNLGKLAKKTYPDWAQWGGAVQQAGTLIRSVEKKYGKDRYKAIWTSAKSHANYRYPVPFPIHNQAWTAFFDEGNRPCVSIVLCGQRVTVRLRGGPEFRRQLAGFRELVNGTALSGEAAVYRVRAGGGKGKVEDRAPGGGQRQQFTVMLKLVGRFPRKERVTGQHTLMVRTDPNAFWVVEYEGRAPWIVNADQIRRWIAAHAAYRQRMSEDLKHEKRWPKALRQQMVESLNKRCEKQNNRLKTWIGQATAMLANFAERNRVGMVYYDDVPIENEKPYLASFPWSELRGELARKLGDRNIVLVDEGSNSRAAS